MFIYEILDETDEVVNTILATEDFVEAVYPGRWKLAEVQPAPEPTPDWPEVIANRRWQAEVSGTTFMGMQIDTDDRSKLLINGAAVEALIDPDYALRWKTPAGFVDLSAEQIIAVARAVRAHVEACFAREDALLAALADGTFEPSMLEEGWPTDS